MPQLDIVVPKLYEDMETAILGDWKKKIGEKVCLGEVLFCLETNKATFDVEAEYAGVLIGILVDSGTLVNPLDVIGTLQSEA